MLNWRSVNHEHGKARFVFLPLLGALALLGHAAVSAQNQQRAAVQIGDCVLFREGGSGYLLKAPSYWLKGKVVEVFSEAKETQLCPRITKAPANYSREDRLALIATWPCVASPEEVVVLNVPRIRLQIQAWETPWSKQHGQVGLLYQGQFLDQVLQKNMLLTMNPDWVESVSCGD